jgi:hypothetical protein
MKHGMCSLAILLGITKNCVIQKAQQPFQSIVSAGSPPGYTADAVAHKHQRRNGKKTLYLGGM